MRAEPIGPPQAFHAEGPVWWPEWDPGFGRDGFSALKYVDLLAGDVLTLSPSGSVSRVHVGRVAAALRPRSMGGAVVATERGFSLGRSSSLTDLSTAADLWGDPGLRFNDGGCDPDGNFYCGTMAYSQARGAGTLWRLGTDGAASAVLEGVTISNGLCWSPEGEFAYYNDTPTGQVDVFDWSSTTGLTRRRRFVAVGGFPDGLCVDEQGGVWVALYGGSAVHRYTAGGVLDEVIELPVTNVTACTFGGVDLKTLFITTTRENVPAGEQPLAGAVFTCRPGVGGIATRPYAA